MTRTRASSTDIGLVAAGNDVADADAAIDRPRQNAVSHRAAVGDDAEAAGRRQGLAEAREIAAKHAVRHVDEAETVRSAQPHACSVRRAPQLILEVPALLGAEFREARRDDHHGANAAGAAFGRKVGNAGRRQGRHHQVGCFGQRRDRWPGLPAVDLRRIRMHEMQ
jgi:hypothetical protein